MQRGFLALVEIGADDQIGQAGFVLQGDKKMAELSRYKLICSNSSADVFERYSNS